MQGFLLELPLWVKPVVASGDQAMIEQRVMTYAEIATSGESKRRAALF